MLLSLKPAFASNATSTNWAGYFITANGVTAITASWAVPAIQCNVAGATPNVMTQGLAVWIGFDGYTNKVIP